MRNKVLKIKKYLKFLSLALLFVLAIGATFELGLWQLHRAQAMHLQQKIQPEKPVVELTKTANAGSNLRSVAFNRLVSFEAEFEKDYVAPNQLVTLRDGSQERKDLRVSLARLDDQRAILVVRGMVGETDPYKRKSKVKISGRLYPRQNVDQTSYSQRNDGIPVLTRLDPALVAGDTGFSLFDGYVIQTGGSLQAPQLLATGGAFYWQHIAYVITWWFMCLLILIFPFYNRIRGQDQDGKSKVEA